MKYKAWAVATLATLSFLVSDAQIRNSNGARKAIICLTYDDGLESHLLTVVPQLDSVGLKATFFLNSIQGSANVVGQASPAVVGWRSAALRGHELGNHTLFHPCPEKLGWAKEVALERYTVDQIVEEIAAQNAVLALLDKTRRSRSFAFPCNNTSVNGNEYGKIIRAKGLVRFGRVGGDRNSIVVDFNKLDPMQVPSWFVEEGTTLPELVAFAEKARRSGTMGVYQFHGVGGQFFKISPETHRSFLRYLKQNEADYVVTTFSSAMETVASK